MPKQSSWYDASPADWEMARQREAVIRPLADQSSLHPDAVSEAAQTLNIGRSLLYRLIRLYRSRPQTSTLLLRRRGRPIGSYQLDAQVDAIINESIRNLFLTKERPRLADLMREIAAVCRDRGLLVPNFRTVKRRLGVLDPSLIVRKREGAKAANAAFKAVGVFNRDLLALGLVQIDHTPVDVIVVDERDRRPIGRPWLSLAIDVSTRIVPGFYVSLDPPSAVSVALLLAHAVLPKDGWLADRELRVPWPVSGLPEVLHMDNAAEFQSEALARGAQEYGISIEYRPPGQPHFGGHIERLIGTTMGAVHLLPGTTFSNVADKGAYRSEKTAVLTLPELESWIAMQIAGVYHQSVHSALHRSPLQAWTEGVARRARPPRQPIDPTQFFFDFLPGELRLIRRDGIRLFNIHYWDNYLSPLAGRSKTPVLIKYDPRNLSRVYVRDQDGRHWPIPYRDLALPPISLWEHREALKRLKEQGRQAVDESLIFATVIEQRKLVDAARRTTKQRRASERVRPLTIASETTSGAAADATDAEPALFEVEEWS